MGFRCPKCHGEEWGSSRQKDGTWKRHCHGGGRRSPHCSYTWPQSDDYKHDIDAEYLLKNETYGDYVGAVDLRGRDDGLANTFMMYTKEEHALRFPNREVALYIKGDCKHLTIIPVPKPPSRTDRVAVGRETTITVEKQ